MVPARLPAAVAARLHPEWPALLRHAWSIRLILLAGLLSCGDVICGALIAHPPFNPVWFSVLAGLFSGAAFVARLLAQKSFSASSDD